jgi:hypothetical protein
MGSTDPIIRAPVGSDSWEFVIHTGPPTNLGQPIPHHVPRSQPIQISLRQRRARLLRPPGRLHIKSFCLETTFRCKVPHIVVKFHSTILVTSVVHSVRRKAYFFFCCYERYRLSDRVTDWTFEESWFGFQQEQEIYLLLRASRSSLGPFVAS